MIENKPKRIVFMGTPDFAVPSLQTLIDCGFDIAAVVTKPDKPSGRGQKFTLSPVKALAIEYSIPVLQPASLKDGDAQKAISELKPDFIIVVAYGKILPPEILAMPTYACINVHASLLPLLRGSAPVNWAIIKGFTETGVTTMLMAEGLDTGDILLTESTPIGDDEMAGELYGRLSIIGGKLLARTVLGFVNETIKPKPQDDKKATLAPMLKKSDGRIDWNKSAEEIDFFVRGMNPWPGSFTTINEKTVKIFSGAPREGCFPDSSPGLIMGTEGNSIKVACKGDGLYEITELQLEGKRRMSAEDFLKGFKVSEGDGFV